MPALERIGLTCCLALAALACTAVVDSVAKPGAAMNSGGSSIAGSPTETASCTDAALIPARVRKVTDLQYMQLVRELLPSATLPIVATPGSELALIKDDAKFVVRGPLAAQYWDAAFALADEARSEPRLLPCSPAPAEATAQRVCVRQWIEEFGMKVFRRPLFAGDIEPLLAVFDVGAETSFEDGVRLVLAALLQSADFLYRTELGDPTAAAVGSEVKLTSYEVASLLSFLLLGGAPDQELYAAAQAGTLSSAQAAGAQLSRLLALPAVQARVAGVFGNVLGAAGALTSLRAATTFPELTPALRQAMDEEARDFVQDNLFGKKPLAELFTSRRAKVDAALAAFYGMAPDPSGYVELPAGQRSGILTRGATLLGLPTGSRSVHRGLFIANNYLCRVLPPPPASLQGEIAQTLALGLNERQVVELRASKATCAGCHANFDGLGLAFEHYDFIGKYLTERDGAPVDAGGELNNSDVDGTFANALELSERLARSKDVALCLPQRVTAQALGISLEDGQKCSVTQLIDAWTRGDRQLGELVPLLVQSRFFLDRAKVD